MRWVLSQTVSATCFLTSRIRVTPRLSGSLTLRTYNISESGESDFVDFKNCSGVNSCNLVKTSDRCYAFDPRTVSFQVNKAKSQEITDRSCQKLKLRDNDDAPGGMRQGPNAFLWGSIPGCSKFHALTYNWLHNPTIFTACGLNSLLPCLSPIVY